MKTCKELLDDIRWFECEPRVFSVSLTTSDHTSGYGAHVDFRTYDPNAISSVSAYADTPEQALANLLCGLTEKFGKCPNCGHYLDGRKGKNDQAT